MTRSPRRSAATRSSTAARSRSGTTPAVARGEAALVRTDPAVGGARRVRPERGPGPAGRGPRPARRCGVIRTDAVDHPHDAAAGPLPVPPDPAVPHRRAAARGRGRPAAGVRRARRATPGWLPPERGAGAARRRRRREHRPDFGERTMTPDPRPTARSSPDHLRRTAMSWPPNSLASHRRVRSASGEIVRGLRSPPRNRPTCSASTSTCPPPPLARRRPPDVRHRPQPGLLRRPHGRRPAPRRHAARGSPRAGTCRARSPPTTGVLGSRSVRDEAERHWDYLRSLWRELRERLPVAPEADVPADPTGVARRQWLAHRSSPSWASAG